MNPTQWPDRTWSGLTVEGFAWYRDGGPWVAVSRPKKDRAEGESDE